MSKSVALLLVLIFLTASCAIIVKPASSSADPVEDSWVSKAPMQQARGGLGVAAVNGKIYAIGGCKGSGLYPPTLYGGFVGTNEEYDPETDTWAFKKPMPTSRSDFAIVVYENKIYCIGGAVGIENYGIGVTDVLSGVNEVYDPTTDMWETKASLPEAGMLMRASVLNGKIHLIDGTFNWVYDPATDAWTIKAPTPISSEDYGPAGTNDYALAVIDNKLYVIGEFSEQLITYDDKVDSWNKVVTVPSSDYFDEAAGATTGVMAPKRIYFLLELRGKPSVNQVYDPKSNRWTSGNAQPTNRLDFDVAVVNDKLYAIGGYTLDSPSSGRVNASALNEQYTPIGYGTPDPSYVPPDSITPEISVMSPKNETCYKNKLPLIFTVSESASWMRFKLDDTRTIDVEGNSTLTGLSAGLHDVTIYATDTAGNTGISETIYFTVDDTPPIILVLAPENKTYMAEIPLNFIVNEKVSGVSYSLDGQQTVTITGNTTLSGLSGGLHNIRVYAEDEVGNVGFSEAITFSVAEPEVSLATLVAAASGVLVAIVGAVLLLYFKKAKKKPIETTVKGYE